MPKPTRADLLEENEVLQLQLDDMAHVLGSPDLESEDKVELLLNILEGEDDEG